MARLTRPIANICCGPQPNLTRVLPLSVYGVRLGKKVLILVICLKFWLLTSVLCSGALRPLEDHSLAVMLAVIKEALSVDICFQDLRDFIYCWFQVGVVVDF